MVTVETLFAALYCAASAAVLAVALSSGRSFFAGAAVASQAAAGRPQTAFAEAALLLLGWLLVGLAAWLWSALCLLSLAVASAGSGRAMALALILAAAAGVGLVALSGSPALVSLYCLATTATAMAVRCCLPRACLALATLRTALLALQQLPQLLELTLCILGAFAAWLAVWGVAALGLAAAAQEEVFAADGSAFPAARCVAHSFSQADRPMTDASR